MQLSTIPYADAALVISLLVAPLPVTAIGSFDCNKVVSDGQAFNLKALGGPHSVVTSQINDGIMRNTTYTLDICDTLKKKGKDEPSCRTGTRVCAIDRIIKPGDDMGIVEDTTSLAGNILGHGALDPEVLRLSKIDPESEREGLRVVLKGGFGIPPHTGVERKKQTVIDFVCDKERDGTEGEYTPGDKPQARAEDDEKEGDSNGDNDKEGDDKDKDEDAPSKEEQLGLDKNPSLLFDRYGPSDSNADVDVLHLTWLSKHVCQSKKDDGSKDDGGNGEDGDGDGDGKKPSSHWGAFTWIVILVFLGTAAYLIFGSWLNYNRYGARGWDLLPHGDTIRDMPYLLKEWARKVLNTVQGSGSRGGYSAV
ncbi:autophagy-related protein 27 [Astrocystis sublimbata]|nr:autophagy-related protein 27 [Astrocystis sublimbata]